MTAILSVTESPLKSRFDVYRSKVLLLRKDADIFDQTYWQLTTQPVLSSIAPVSGTGGASITIDLYGTGFSAVSVAWLGTQSPDSTTLISDTHLQIMFVKLPVAGTYAVTVQNGGLVSQAVNFTVT